MVDVSNDRKILMDVIVIEMCEAFLPRAPSIMVLVAVGGFPAFFKAFKVCLCMCV